MLEGLVGGMEIVMARWTGSSAASWTSCCEMRQSLPPSEEDGRSVWLTVVKEVALEESFMRSEQSKQKRYEPSVMDQIALPIVLAA